VYPAPWSGTARATTVLAVGLSAVLLAGLYVVYYGKEREFYFTKDEVAASQYLHTKAPAGSIFVGGTQNYPWAFRNYERYRYVAISEQPHAVRQQILGNPVMGIQRLVAEEKRGAPNYVIITRSQDAEVEMTGVLYRDSLVRIQRAVAQSPQYHIVYDGPDAKVFAATRPGTSM
jgi:hypothetical protein